MAHIPTKETLTCEFKSDRRCLSDKDLIEAVVCMANGEGGDIYLGVEDDGTVTGLHAKHALLDGLAAMIANRTHPAQAVTVTPIEVKNKRIARIAVPKSGTPVATNEGLVKRRRLKANGEPECVPFLPVDFSSRRASFGLIDISSQPVSGSTLSDLNSVERNRLRQFIERLNGDQALLELDDHQLDAALGLVARTEDGFLPTLTGLLLIGLEGALRNLVPSHEIAFQVLDGEEVRLNEFTRSPLLSAIERIETLLKPLNPEKEFQDGLFRVAVPKIDPRAFREAFANAITHRDYGQRGAVHIRMQGDEMVISNPGGFVEGVSLSNLLTTEPRPRNPALADALKRIGLVERTGRGVDLIYRGMLRFGRHIPDFSQSDSHTVVLRLSLEDADEEFLKVVLKEESRLGGRLPIDSLIILNALREGRRLQLEEIASQVQKEPGRVKASVERLVESGLLQAHGSGRGRNYTLSHHLYDLQGKKAEYIRQAGFSKLQNEQLVKNYVTQHGRITRSEVMELCHLDKDQAYRLLKKLVADNELVRHGVAKLAYYTFE
ncbi:DNA glycosylase AlkZ-like family protein [Bowmanella dokdonensis]|uniref:DNA binding domain-containing protein n=1 Tax=Bowmanella dokdonensis TaxID=751969 RepID=A0A939IRR9_9ALTE|nr:crosslink repair DNA glycosylase YcaQ family protein [Bowmanella dokdonensis]MBN7825781.1 putative DNA binding domain-containing protein [Bowmanella dokdonensis]